MTVPFDIHQPARMPDPGQARAFTRARWSGDRDEIGHHTRHRSLSRYTTAPACKTIDDQHPKCRHHGAGSFAPVKIPETSGFAENCHSHPFHIDDEDERLWHESLDEHTNRCSRRPSQYVASPSFRVECDTRQTPTTGDAINRFSEPIEVAETKAILRALFHQRAVADRAAHVLGAHVEEHGVTGHGLPVHAKPDFGIERGTTAVGRAPAPCLV